MNDLRVCKDDDLVCFLPFSKLQKKTFYNQSARLDEYVVYGVGICHGKLQSNIQNGTGLWNSGGVYLSDTVNAGPYR